MATVAAELRGLKLAFIPGTGRMGYALARKHAKAGFQVTIGSRSFSKAQSKVQHLKEELSVTAPKFAGGVRAAEVHDAVDEADVVFWAAGPTGSLCKGPADLETRYEYLRSLRKHLEGKLIVDVTNVMYAYDDSHWGRTSSLLLNQEALGVPARWTCAWKHVFFKRLMADPVNDLQNPFSVLVCGDDQDAKDTVIGLVNALPGFAGLDAGSANHSRIVELLGPKWLQELETWNFDTKYEAGWRYGPF